MTSNTDSAGIDDGTKPADPIVMIPSTPPRKEPVSTNSSPTRSENGRTNTKKIDMNSFLSEDITVPEKERITIAFRDIEFSVPIPKKEQNEKKKRDPNQVPETTKKIIKGVSGIFRSGRLTAVMGASGAGKTSLLQLLAGETHMGTLLGSFYVNGVAVTGNEMKSMSGFVFQDDIIMASMTVREAIMMAARLRLPASLSIEEKTKRVDGMIRLLNLEKAQHTPIGNAIIKGVSGGERKRTAMAMEIITNPKILFLDEPTSGLDTFTAYSVVKTLKDLAKTGRTVISTIHQPSSEIFHLFDDLILMAEGKIVYSGPVENAIDYFSKMGYICPTNSNPSDYIFMTVLNSDPNISPPDEKETPAQRIQRAIDIWESSDSYKELSIKIDKTLSSDSKFDVSKAVVKNPSTFGEQYSFLFDRASKNAFRNPFIVKIKAVQTIFFSLISGLLYYQTNKVSGYAAYQNRSGFLFFLIINNTFSSAFGVLNVFSDERRVFTREYGAGFYGLTPYFLSKMLVEMPFYTLFPFVMVVLLYWTVGLQNTADRFFIAAAVTVLSGLTGFSLGIFFACAFKTLEIALMAAPLTLLPLILFSGLFANVGAIPVYFDWIKYISPMKYGFEALFKNEFYGLDIACVLERRNGTNVEVTVPGTVCVKQQGFDDGLNILACSMILLGMMIGLAFLAYFSLFNIVRKDFRTIEATKKSKSSKGSA